MKAISAIVVTLNEEDRIGPCLESVSFCDEIVVVDAGSADQTVEIAGKYTGRVIHHEWESYRAQKAYAIDQASQPWILVIDSDERLSPGLQAEIRSLPEDPPEDAFIIRRDFYFMGRLLKHGGAWPDWNLRLFRADRFKMEGTETHEKITVPGANRKLDNPMMHYSYRDLDDYFNKFNKFTSLGAMERYEKGIKAGLLQNLRVPYEFVARYIFRCGFLDGYPGFVYAMISSFYAWMKYAKLKEMTDYSEKGGEKSA